MRFEPIAIVGRACVFPGALDVAAFARVVLEGRDSVGPVPEGRWRVPREQVLGSFSTQARDRAFSDRGGYVTGFESVFDPQGFDIPAAELRGLDPLALWLLHTAREALRDGQIPGEARGRTGAIIGNLSLPSEGLAQFVEGAWLEAQGGFLGGKSRERASLPRPDPRNRFMSGLPAHLVARALGLGGVSFALDAACASSLYAIKYACDRLHDREADVMLAGAVSRADSLFLHVGFSALLALSPSGRSRPFHKDADGLLPAEGAAFVALKRLSDAAAAGDRILGVIRGVGLGNDGRGAGLLVPSEEGQERALRLAYQTAGLEPKDISLLECHATGTPIGDATEIKSLGRLYRGLSDVPIGSVKSNLGHPITAAGLAGLLKLLAAFEARVRPPTLHSEKALDALRDSPFRLCHAAEPWPSAGPRRAAVSAFGFGGNNAHLIVEEWIPGHRESLALGAAAAPERASQQVAIVAIGARVGSRRSADDFARLVLGGASEPAHRMRAEAVELELAGLRFPPSDLDESLAQQLLLLAAAREATTGVTLPRERTAVLMGMQCDALIARFGGRLRAIPWSRAWAAAAGGDPDPAWQRAAQDSFHGPLLAASVLGRLPNIVANRINSQLDLQGGSASISAEELSGIRALELARRALLVGEIDAALVGAVDVSCEPTHERAARELLDASRHAAGDAAVVLVLKRKSDAERDGDRVLALLDDVSDPAGVDLVLAAGGIDLTPLTGHAHAASGLLQVAAAALALERRALPTPDGPRPWIPGASGRRALVATSALGAAAASVGLREGAHSRGGSSSTVPRLHVFSGEGRRGVIQALRAGSASNRGPARLVIVAAGDAELEEKRGLVLALLEAGRNPDLPGVSFRETPITGDVAFVFAAAAGARRGMGRDLLLAWPELLDRAARGFGDVRSAAGWLYDAEATVETDPLRKLWAASLLCQVHFHFARQILGLSPQAALGVSSGETNALVALGAWSDLAGLRADFESEEIFGRWLSGRLEAVQLAWGVSEPVAWKAMRLRANEERVAKAILDEPRAYLTIVNTPDDVVIAGDQEACARVAVGLGVPALDLSFDVAAHCPEVAFVGELWRRVHHRPTRPVPGVRFYSHATGGAYVPTDDSAADALLAQATRTIRFPDVVESAWKDGARIFVELGPGGACTGAIRSVLGDREHVAIALDSPDEGSLHALLCAIAPLVAAGVAISPALDEALARLRAPAPSASPVKSFAVHPPPVVIPPLPLAKPRAMAAAPWLPPILSERSPEPAPPRITLRPAPAALRVETTTGAPAPPATPSASPLVAAFESHVRRQNEAHTRFLSAVERIDGAHQDFLRASETALRGIVQVVGSEPRALRPSPPRPSPPAASSPAAPIVPEPRIEPGVHLTRADLETHAGGRISTIFGPAFAKQDGFHRQVRMPMPPLLLADRCTEILAKPGVLGRGSLRTETDVKPDSWYLHRGRMPAGIMVESGQADLLLISWMGVDFLNQGERVYRLLGCELRFHGSLPKPGDTLAFDIHVDGHAQQGDVRLFFFHYDCTIDAAVRLSVRNGQAGFFTDEELAASGGVLWDPETTPAPADCRLDPPAVSEVRRAFSREQIRAFGEGRMRDAFGPTHIVADAHVKTPRLPADKLCLLQDVDQLDPSGGPWGRGYLRARRKVSPDDWFFEGHFKNDPCMPGTLMYEGCLQAMALYMTAFGFTLEHDGWRFEPVPDETYTLRCRGQVIPSSNELVYELFVSEVRAGPVPTLYADILCSVDGRKAFHCARMGLRLVPDWPLESGDRWPETRPARRPVASTGDFAFDHDSLMACAWGRPSLAFGPGYVAFDGPRRLPRLPGPPYHFMSRVTKLEGEFGVPKAGAFVEAEYDVPEDAWYFDESGQSRIPFAVLMEIALQPCGWLTSYLGIPLRSDEELAFRNLDGTGVASTALGSDTGTLRTRVRAKNISQSAGLLIEGFDVECFRGETRIFAMQTVFGHFPPAAFANQVGLPPTAEERTALAEPSGFLVDLSARPERYCAGALRLPGPRLLMLDRVTGYWPDAGRAALGRLRAEKTVRPEEWFFKCHFFQDPVQPGSLGVEAMVQLLQFYAIERGLGDGIPNPVFESPMADRPVTWKYRGQVRPTNGRVQVELEVTEIGKDERGAFAVADAWLWVDELRIYQATSLAVRIVPGPARPAARLAEPKQEEERLDPTVDTWLADHRPTYAMPVLPMMWVVDRLARAAQAAHPAERVLGLRDARMARWVAFPGGAVRLRTELQEDASGTLARLLVWRDAADPRMSRFEPAAEARVLLGAAFAAPPAPLPRLDAAPVEDPYASGALFHGPALQLLQALWMNALGSGAILDAGKNGLPRGLLHPALLDAITHAIPNDAMEIWFGERGFGQIAYPARITSLDVFGETPVSGEVRCEVRPDGLDGPEQMPACRAQLIVGDRTWVELRLVMALFPKGPLGATPREGRRAFLRDHIFVPGLGLSQTNAGVTTLSETAVHGSDWLPGTVAATYAAKAADLTRVVATKEHVARKASVHPSEVEVSEDGASAVALTEPLVRYEIAATPSSEGVSIRDAGEPRRDLGFVQSFWRELLGVGPWPVEDIHMGFLDAFVRNLRLADADLAKRLKSGPILYLANHQVAVESLTFGVLLGALTRRPVLALAKAQHRQSWIGRLQELAFSYRGVRPRELILYFDRDDQASLPALAQEMRLRMTERGESFLVHVEGTRAVRCGEPVTKMSSVFADLAIAANVPVVPVRFAGALPREAAAARLEFPVGLGAQDIHLGRPLLPESLQAMSLVEKKAAILGAINDTGPRPEEEAPNAPNPKLSTDVADRRTRLRFAEVPAVALAVLACRASLSEETRDLLATIAVGRSDFGSEASGQWLAALAGWLTD